MASPPSDQDVQLTFLTTGTVRIRPSMQSQPAYQPAIFRRIRSLCDRKWTEPLPVGVFLLRHPEGNFLFDTGQSPCCNNSGYFPRLAFFNGLLSEFTLEHKDGVVEQLRGLGVEPADLKGIILSHLHNDHAGGLEDLLNEAPDLPVYISREHWKAFGEHPYFASMEGATPNHWPKGFAPKIVDLEDKPLGPWKQSFPVTDDVIYSRENNGGKQTTYFLPGDATYGLDYLDKEEPDGINDDPMRALATLKTIKQFAREAEVVILPSHDPSTPRLLADRVAYRPMRPPI
ncbi:unnamed protein product [Penicillium pancosmium]